MHCINSKFHVFPQAYYHTGQFGILVYPIKAVIGRGRERDAWTGRERGKEGKGRESKGREGVKERRREGEKDGGRGERGKAC